MILHEDMTKKESYKFCRVFILVLILLSSLILLALVGCAAGEDKVTRETIVEKSNRFVYVGDYYNIFVPGNDMGKDMYVFYDSKTQIVYLSHIGSTGSLDMCPLYNSSGVPMTLEEYEETK